MGANVGKTLYGLGCGLGGVLCGFAMVESGHLVRLNGLSKYATNGGLLGIGLTLVTTATAAAIGYYFKYPVAPWLLTGFVAGSALGAGTLNLALDQNLDQPLPTLPIRGRPLQRRITRWREQFMDRPVMTPGILQRAWADDSQSEVYEDEVVYVTEDGEDMYMPPASMPIPPEDSVQSIFRGDPPQGVSPAPSIEGC